MSDAPPPTPRVGSGYPPIPGSAPSPASPPTLANDGATAALGSVVVAAVSILAWLVPAVGLPLAVAGIVLALRGRRSTSRRTLATAALVVCVLSVIASIANAGYGVYLVSRHAT